MGYLNLQQGIARGKLLLILFAIAVFAIVGITFVANRPNEREQRSVTNSQGYRSVADQFIKTMTENKSEAAFNLMTEAAKQDMGGPEAWKKTVSEGFSRGKGNPQFVSALPIEDPNAVYKGQQPTLVTYNLEQFGSKWQTSLTVIKDGESWKIDRMITELR